MTRAALGMVAAAVIGALGLASDWRPYGLLAGWRVIGVIYYAERRPPEVAWTA